FRTVFPGNYARFSLSEPADEGVTGVRHERADVLAGQQVIDRPRTKLVREIVSPAGRKHDSSRVVREIRAWRSERGQPRGAACVRPSRAVVVEGRPEDWLTADRLSSR